MKQPFSANNNANTGLKDQQTGSFSQNQFAVHNGPEWNNNNARNASISGNVRHVSSGYHPSSNGQLFDNTMNSPQSFVAGTQQFYHPTHVRPMYQSVQTGGRLPNSSGQKGNRVYQQIIHNNGSGNILFSSSNLPV